MNRALRHLPVSAAALLRLLSGVAVLAMVLSMGAAKPAAQAVVCSLDSIGCYGDGCANPVPPPSGIRSNYAIDNYYCTDNISWPWYEAYFRGCCLDADPQVD
jgi:hypothetical protein